MDLVTIVVACAMGLHSGLFVPLGLQNDCPRAMSEARPLIDGTRRPSIDRWSAEIALASRRFAVPEPLIRAVMRAESDGVATTTSSAGAMGLMQLMPGTWADMRLRYTLGDDPYAPADNILAGAAFLRELIDRYGTPDFLAAYNAGPRRVDALRESGLPLPAETRRYVAQLEQVAGAAVSGTISGDELTLNSARTPLKQGHTLAQPLLATGLETRTGGVPDRDRRAAEAVTILPSGALHAAGVIEQSVDRGNGLFVQLGSADR